MRAVPEIVSAAATARPEHPALVFHDRAMTYRELDDLVDRTAAALHERGVAKGDRVAILLGNIPEFVHVLHGVMRLGAVAVPLNLMLTPEELGYVLADAEARAVVVGIDLMPAVLSVRDRLGSLDHILMVGPPPTPPGTRSLDELVDAAGRPPEVEVGPDDLALLAYTQLRLARPLVRDRRLPWERRRPPGKLTPARVRRTGYHLHASVQAPLLDDEPLDLLRVYHVRFSGDANGADTHPTLVRPDRCETIYIGTGDCGRLTHERGGQVATNSDRFGHRCVKRNVYTSCYANLKSSRVDG